MQPLNQMIKLWQGIAIIHDKNEQRLLANHATLVALHLTGYKHELEKEDHGTQVRTV